MLNECILSLRTDIPRFSSAPLLSKEGVSLYDLVYAGGCLEGGGGELGKGGRGQVTENCFYLAIIVAESAQHH